MDISGQESNLLDGKRIVLCVTGSVAAVRSADVARGLMRHGASVTCVMSSAATRIIHPDLLHWASGRPVVTELTGAIEHVALAGNVADKADLVIVAPATANTIGKIAAAIDDTPVTTLVTTALGEGIPLLVVPAMHESMYNHPLVRENIAKLEKIGVRFLQPVVREGKAKIAATQEILETALALCRGQNLFALKRVLITLGRTVEPIDPIRVITNNSSGKMGAALAFTARVMGAAVTVVAGKTDVELPAGVKRIDAVSAQAMFDAVKAELEACQYDYFIGAAAVGDWQSAAVSAKKIPTRGEKKLTLEFLPTPKIIDRVKEWSPKTYLAAFRAVHDLTDTELERDGRERLARANADCIVCNDTAKPGVGFGTDTNEVTVITAAGEIFRLPRDTKKNIALGILSIIHQQSPQAR